MVLTLRRCEGNRGTAKHFLYFHDGGFSKLIQVVCSSLHKEKVVFKVVRARMARERREIITWFAHYVFIFEKASAIIILQL